MFFWVISYVFYFLIIIKNLTFSELKPYIFKIIMTSHMKNQELILKFNKSEYLKLFNEYLVK